MGPNQNLRAPVTLNFKTALVTGGGGFLGSHLVQALKARGVEVRSFSRKTYSSLEKMGVHQFSGDLSDFASVEKAVKDCEVIFHTAGLVGLVGNPEEFYNANVLGTENIIKACRLHGVRRLVFTSSPSVVFNGQDMDGVNESVPYAQHFESHYPKTKAEAEKVVLAANDSSLFTVALRPHLIWGPHDPHIISRILSRAQSRMGIKRIKGPPKRVDFSWVTDVALAHLLAAEKLVEPQVVGGKVYFISQGDPISFWDFADEILSIHGFPKIKREIPAGLALMAATVLEKIFSVLNLGEPPYTRFLVKELCTSHWFDISAARKDLGYSPSMTMKEAFELYKDQCK